MEKVKGFAFVFLCTIWSAFVVFNQFFFFVLRVDSQTLNFTEKLEAACIGAVESGKMTKDLALIIHGSKYVYARM